MSRHHFFSVLTLAVATCTANAVIINVPGDQPTIQAGIDAAFDGDEVIMRAWCHREGAARIGFGECRGIVLPAV